MRAAPLALVALLASACISITPHAQVAQVTEPPAASVRPVSTPTGSIAPEPSIIRGTLPPGSTPSPSPAHTPKPTQPTPPPPTLNADDPACADPAFTLEGFSWNTVYRWRFNAESTPAGLDPDSALAVLKSGFDHITNEWNDCGRPDNVHAFAQYQGKTTQEPCTDQPDGQNTVGFGTMPAGVSADAIAYTCPFYDRANGGIAFEADIVISTGLSWALSTSDCFFQELLEPTITHEAGHVFGLGHVTESQHPDLTMSTQSNGPCNNDESTLGLGDMLGLEQLYPGS